MSTIIYTPDGLDNIPAALLTLLANGWARSHRLLDITLPNGSEIHLGTVEVVVDGVSYTADLRDIGICKFGLTRPVDRVELSAQNIDRALGISLLETESILDDAPAVFSKLIVNRHDSSEMYKVIRCTGKIANAEAGETEITFQVISDVYAARKVGAAINMPAMDSTAESVMLGISPLPIIDGNGTGIIIDENGIPITKNGHVIGPYWKFDQDTKGQFF